MKTLNKIFVIIASILGATAYRMGGSGNYNRLWRIMGVSFLSIVAVISLHGIVWGYWWLYVLCFGLSCGAVASYWGLDEKKWGYWAHGLGLALALLPLAYLTGHYLGWAMRSLAIIAFITLWSQFTSWDILEECGRGAGIVFSLLLTIIG